jgi:hypothetical protein
LGYRERHRHAGHLPRVDTSLQGTQPAVSARAATLTNSNLSFYQYPPGPLEQILVALKRFRADQKPDRDGKAERQVPGPAAEGGYRRKRPGQKPQDPAPEAAHPAECR